MAIVVCIDDATKDQFILDYERQGLSLFLSDLKISDFTQSLYFVLEGIIHLDPSKIERNAGLRAIAKVIRSASCFRNLFLKAFSCVFKSFP